MDSFGSCTGSFGLGSRKIQNVAGAKEKGDFCLGDSTERGFILQGSQHLNSRGGSSSSKEAAGVETSLGQKSSSGQEILQKARACFQYRKGGKLISAM